ncbi:response regulator [bacterium]|nr:response regulator [bacterium]
MNAKPPQHKVLVVDDDPHLLNLLEIRLSEQSFDVTVASSANVALEKAIANPPDIVIADIMMPGMDGYALCGKIRASENLHNIPFIFLSALADTQDKVKGLRLGADDYLTKPFEFRELLARIEILLDRYSRYRETFKREEESEVATSGRIEDLGVIDLLQMLSFGQKTGEVSLESSGEQGALYLAAGRLIAANYRNKHGLAALPTLLSWSDGTFKVKLTESLSVIPSIENQTDEAIFESLRELDEAERIKQELDIDAVPALKPGSEPSTDGERVVCELADGKISVREMLLESPLSDFDTLEALKSMIASGAVELAGKAAHEKTEAKEEEEESFDTKPQPVTHVFNLVVIGTDRDSRNIFIHTISGEEEAERPEDKVLNFGKVIIGPYQFNMYGLPGAKRFAPLWQTFVAKVQGMILLANSAVEEEVSNLKFALALLRERVSGPAVIINTDPTKPEIELGNEFRGTRTMTCLPSDRIKSAGILKDLAKEIAR